MHTLFTVSVRKEKDMDADHKAISASELPSIQLEKQNEPRDSASQDCSAARTAHVWIWLRVHRLQRFLKLLNQ